LPGCASVATASSDSERSAPGPDAFCCGALPRDWHIADMPAALVDVRTWVEWEREVTKYQPELFYRALADANAMRVAAASMELAITFAVRGNLK